MPIHPKPSNKTFTTNFRNSTVTWSSSTSKKTTSNKTKSNSSDNNSDLKKNSNESKPSHSSLDILLKWSIKTMVLSLPQAEPITMSESSLLWTENNLRHPPVSPCIDTATQLSISSHPNLMPLSKWCKFRKNPMLPSLISVVVMSKNNKWDKPSNYHLPTLSFTHKSVLTHQKVSSCMAHQVQEKLWWLRPLLTIPLQLSSES